MHKDFQPRWETSLVHTFASLDVHDGFGVIPCSEELLNYFHVTSTHRCMQSRRLRFVCVLRPRACLQQRLYNVCMTFEGRRDERRPAESPITAIVHVCSLFNLCRDTLEVSILKMNIPTRQNAHAVATPYPRKTLASNHRHPPTPWA